MTNPNLYQVIVSNVGEVYSGLDAQSARDTYKHYKEQSEQAIGRAAGEDVTLMFKGEPYQEYVGVISEAHSAVQEHDDSEGCGNCPACLLADAIKKRNRIKSEQSAGVSYHDNYTDAVLALTLYNRSKGEGQSFSLSYHDTNNVPQVGEAFDTISNHGMYYDMQDGTSDYLGYLSCALGGEADGGAIYMFGNSKDYKEHHYFIVYQL